MKILLALTIILGGVLVTQTSFAIDTSKTPSSIFTTNLALKVVPTVVDPTAHVGNIADCPLMKNGGQLNFTAQNNGGAPSLIKPTLTGK